MAKTAKSWQAHSGFHLISCYFWGLGFRVVFVMDNSGLLVHFASGLEYLGLGA